MQDYIPRIARVLFLMMTHADRQVLSDAAWAVASFTTTEWAGQTKELLVQNGILKALADAIVYVHSHRHPYL